MGTNIKFDTYELVTNPSDVTIIKKDKYCSSVKTYSGVGYFNWGVSIIGKELEISWDYMTTAEFTILNGYYENDDQKVLDPQDGSAKTYNIKVKSFDGKYFITMKDETGAYRKDVRMVILILSEVA